MALKKFIIIIMARKCTAFAINLGCNSYNGNMHSSGMNKDRFELARTQAAQSKRHPLQFGDGISMGMSTIIFMMNLL